MSHAGSERAPAISDADYQKFRALFFSALAGLARRGYPVPPDDGLDLVHDFFVEAWPSLVERHDPAKSRLSTYAFSAFVQFARPRIVKLHRWRRQLDEEAVEEAGDDGSGVELKIDGARLERARQALSFEDREPLEARFVKGQSERDLAKALGITRYRARERLAQSLTRLVSGLQDRALSNSTDWQIALAIWRDGRPLAAIAAELGLTEDQVRARKRKIIAALTRATPLLTAAPRGNHVDRTL